VSWAPANPVEEAMHSALARSDAPGYFQVVAKAALYLPATAAGEDMPPQLMTAEVDGRRSVLAFTSPQRAQQVPGTDTVIAVGYRELVENWPDPAWPMALDPGTPIGCLVPVDTVVRVALGPGDGPLRFEPANPVERGLQVALAEDDPDLLFDVLVTATVWAPEAELRADGMLAVFTSAEYLATTFGSACPASQVPLLDLIAGWPDGEPLAVNPGSPIEVVVAADRVASILEWAATLPVRYPDAGRAG
jgi:SseB protein N-terminal domain